MVPMTSRPSTAAPIQGQRRLWWLSTEITLFLSILLMPAVYFLSVGPAYRLNALGYLPNEVYEVYIVPLVYCVPPTSTGGDFVRSYLTLWEPS